MCCSDAKHSTDFPYDHGGKYIKDAFEHEQYAADAFRLHVSDFWLYPYTAERVEEAFRNLRHTPEKGITV